MEIAAIVILCVLYAAAEVPYDKKIRESHQKVISSLTGRLSYRPAVLDKIFNDLIHKDQMPLRLVSAGLIATIGVLSGVHIISAILIVSGALWASVDLICNLWWLKQPALYVGNTADTDKVLNNPLLNWGLKIVLLSAGILIEVL